MPNRDPLSTHGRCPRPPSTAALTLLVVAALSGGLWSAAAVSAERGEESSERPVVIELFTSQGCSSCPPADRLLSRLAADDAVIALSFHVDYWNRLGWIDPFSKAEWSRRQSLYGRFFRLDGVYTPQAVIGGRSQVVGSDESQVREALAQARSRPSRWLPRIDLRATLSGRKVEVEADLVALGEAKVPSSGELVVVLTESALETSVPRGENAGRTLLHDGVVRSLDRAPAKVGAHRFVIDLDEAWRVGRLKVVAFLQESKAGRIQVASSIDL